MEYLWNDTYMDILSRVNFFELTRSDAENPVKILGNSIGRVSALLLILLAVIVIVAAIPGGPGLTVVDDPAGAVGEVGVVELTLPFGGPTIQANQLIVFLGFVVFTLVMLAVIASAMALVMYKLSRGLAESPSQVRRDFE